MDVGPEMDVEVARVVFGRAASVMQEYVNKNSPRRTVAVYDTPRVEVPSYSTDAAAAMAIPERLWKDWRFKRWQLSVDPGGGWTCETRLQRDISVEYEATGDTAAEAICRSALSALAETG